MAGDATTRVFCTTCATLGDKTEDGGLPSGWQELTDGNGRPMLQCPQCMRQNLWVLEGGWDLDPGSGF